VPEPSIRRLQAEMASPDGSSSDAARLRSCRSVLRDGAELERQYAGAPNLYVVPNLMLAAARAIVEIEGTAESQSAVVDVAGRMLASGAPLAGKIQGDILML
jgi:hypothetical protein